MMIFLLLYFSIYGSMNLYFLWRVHAACGNWGMVFWAVTAFDLLMVAAPILTRVLDRAGVFWLASSLGLVGHFWMAFMLWFLAIGVSADVINVTAKVAALSWQPAAKLSLSPKIVLAAFGVFCGVASLWGAWEAGRIRLKEVTITTPRIAGVARPLRIVQICDLHLGLTVRGRRLRQVMDLVEEAKPDLLVCTGDLVDASFQHVAELAKRLTTVRPRLGKFAVLGNHEYHAGFEDSLIFLKTAGFRVLRGESTAVGDRMRLVGVDDPSGRYAGEPCDTNESAALPAERDTRFTVLLKHRPSVRQESLGRFDLQLSGHSHGGQIVPFNWIVNLVYPLRPGLHDLGQGSFLYHSRGTCTWGPPIRLFSPAEVTVLVLKAP